MQRVSQHWLQTNSAPFTDEGNIYISLRHGANNSLLMDDQWILSFKQEINGSLLSGSLFENKITVTVDNHDGRFIYDESSDLYRNNRINFIYSFAITEYENGESYKTYDPINGAEMFVRSSTFDNDKQTVTLECADILSFLTETYTGRKTGNGFEIAGAVISQARISNIVPISDINANLDADALSAVVVNIPQDKHYSLRDILQMVANAAMCVIFVDRSGRIHIERITDIDGSVLASLPSQQYTIGRNVQYTSVKSELSPNINRVTVIFEDAQNEGMLDFPDTEGQEQTLENAIIANDPEQGDKQVNYLILWIYNTLKCGRTVYSGTYRADPRVDLFDIIFIEAKNDDAVPCILTSLQLEYTGAWRGTFKAVSANVGSDITDINSLEGLTINDLETHTLNELEGN